MRTKQEHLNWFINNERALSLNNRWTSFENTLRNLLLDVTISEKDRWLLDDIKQAVIIFSMKDRFKETNEIFLQNAKADFYRAIEGLESNHNTLKWQLVRIKLFMEDFYFNSIEK